MLKRFFSKCSKTCDCINVKHCEYYSDLHKNFNDDTKELTKKTDNKAILLKEKTYFDIYVFEENKEK